MLLHFDCRSGISGDMILGALVDAGVPVEDLVRRLRGVPVKGYRLRARRVRRGGLRATKVEVEVRTGYRAPLTLSRIRRIIAASRIPASVKGQARDTFDRLAKAEGRAHGQRPEAVHFHEVGVVDSLVDVLGGLLGVLMLGVERVTASPVNLGSGTIATSHGTLPVPGPAVAALSRGIPVYSAGPTRELTTPTGLALLRTLTREFGPMPLMRPTEVGQGAGSADPKGWPNVLRVFLGQAVPDAGNTSRSDRDAILQIETNLDDVNPQVYDGVMDRLFEAGALDVTLTPVIMKQGRPGIVLAALAPRGEAGAVASVILGDTTSLGVRMWEVTRWVLPRQIRTVRISGGTVRIKVATVGTNRTKAAPEYQDCRRIAERTGRPVREILETALLAYHRKHSNSK
ncbi:MAG: nickel pincer cofactor biosynthesis protein LarC [Nitrospirales bacterium]